MNFDETTLRSEIIQTWGEHGAHIDVYDELMSRAKPEMLGERIRFCSFEEHARRSAAGEAYIDDDEASADWFPYCADCLKALREHEIRWWGSELTAVVWSAFEVARVSDMTGAEIVEELSDRGVIVHLKSETAGRAVIREIAETYRPSWDRILALHGSAALEEAVVKLREAERQIRDAQMILVIENVTGTKEATECFWDKDYHMTDCPNCTMNDAIDDIRRDGGSGPTIGHHCRYCNLVWRCRP